MSTIRSIAAATALFLALCGLAAAQDGETPEVAALRAALADYGVDGDLALIDEALRMRVLAGEIDRQQADAEIIKRGAALRHAAPDEARRAEILAEHRHAMEHLFAVIDKAIRTAPQWPADRSAEDYELLASTKLALLRDDYNAALRYGDDPTPIVLSAEALLALTRGVADLPLAQSAFVDTVDIADTGATTGTGTSTRTTATGGRSTGTGSGTAGTTSTGTTTAGTTTTGTTTTGTTTTGTTTTLVLPPGPPAATGSLAWVDQTEDQVGPWDQGTPDGQLDGHFKLLLRLPQAIEIASIAIYSADANGAMSGGQVWHSANASHYVLGVHNLGFRLNSKHVASLGIHKGDVTFDLYAASSGWFNQGQNFLVEVTFADGGKWTSVAAVGGAPAVGSEQIPPPVAYTPEYLDFLLSTRFEWIDNGQPIGTITFGDGAQATWNPTQQDYAFDVNGDLLVSAPAEGPRWVTRLRFDPATATFSGTRDASSATQDGVQTVMRPAPSAPVTITAVPVADQLAQLQASLSREDYARLYADLSVLIARYGNTIGWLDGQDPAGPATDPGRGVTSWDAHYGYAVGGSAAAAGFIVARIDALRAALPAATMADLEAQVSQVISGYGGPGGTTGGGAGTVPVTTTLEDGTDRPGMDYTSFDLDQAEPALCQAACEQAEQCRAFTYVAPGAQGALARCWLKSDVPQAQPNTCCVSGVKGAAVASADGYLGCFKDPNAPFDLEGYLERSGQNTPQRCIDICRAKGFAFAGVQYGESCLCGNRYGQFGAADNCTMPCTGDASQACGGANANSVYAVGASLPSSASIDIVSGTYGINCGQPEGNVTGHLASACGGKTTCDYKVDVGVIGDPANGCQKDYVAKWRCGDGDVIQSASAAPEAGYGSVVRLSCATN